MENKAVKSLLFVCVFTIGVSFLAFSEEITLENSGNKVLDMVNKYFVPDKNAKLLESPVEESGLYKVTLSIGGNKEPFYITKDGALFIFSNGIVDVDKFEESAKQQEEMEQKMPQQEEMRKTEKPVVELFVMSLCPYGSRAESKIMPVIKKFGDKVDFQLKFIVEVKGTTLNEVMSMHGSNEVREDARQAAIIKYYPDKFGAYIKKIDENSCLLSCGAIKLEDYWKKVAKGLRMDVKKIESFAYGPQAMTLLKQSEADGKKYNATASPTMFINGVINKAIYKDEKTLEEAICSAFVIPPENCRK